MCDNRILTWTELICLPNNTKVWVEINPDNHFVGGNIACWTKVERRCVHKLEYTSIDGILREYTLGSIAKDAYEIEHSWRCRLYEPTADEYEQSFGGLR